MLTLQCSIKKIGVGNAELTLVDYPTTDDPIRNDLLKSSDRVKQEGNMPHRTILDKVKKGIWLFLEGEEIVRKHDFFLHKYGVLSWESKYGSPTPFLAEIEEEETILKPAFDVRGRFDIWNVDVGGKCDLFKTNTDHDCIIVDTQFFMQGLELKDV